jgi:hypothetical protein
VSQQRDAPIEGEPRNAPPASIPLWRSPVVVAALLLALAIVFHAWGEHAENELRKDFTSSERVAITEALRTHQHGGDRQSDQAEHVPLESITTNEAAKRAGLGNERTFRQARAVVESGTPELVQAMDEGRASIRAAADVATLPVERTVGAVARQERA